MNQTSLVGRPLAALTAAVVGFAEKRGIWSGPLTSSSPELARLWSAPPVSTGITVNAVTAYTYSVFWACVNDISTDIASFPLILYKREANGGKTVLRDHNLYALLHDAPNPEMTAFTFRGLLTSQALTWGMGYAEIVRDGAGRVVELWPITADRVRILRAPAQPYRLSYAVTREDGGMDALRSDQMFVLPGSTFDGVHGRNIITMARESIGLGIAAERFAGTFYGNGATFGGVFVHPGRMSELAMKNFRQSVNLSHQGVDKAHQFFVTEEGMQYQKLGVDPNNAQFIETRQHQVEEMCRWFRMPPHKVQHLIRASFNSLEQLNIEYTSDTLQPRCVSWEQEILRQLIAPSERRIQFVKHNMDSKLRGDTTTRFAAYVSGIQNGFLSQDDVREKEDMNPLADGAGTQYFIQSNTWPLDRVQEIIDHQVAPKPAPVAPAPPTPDPNAPQQNARDLQEAIQTALTEVEARIVATTEQITGLRSEKAQTQEAADAIKAALLAVQGEHSQAQQEGIQLRGLLQEATERVAWLTQEQEAIRLAAVDAEVILRQQVDAAHAEAAAASATGAAEAARLQALADDTAARLASEQAELVREQAEHDRVTDDWSTAAVRLTAERDAALEESTAREQALSVKDAQIAEAQMAIAEARAVADRAAAEREAALILKAAAEVDREVAEAAKIADAAKLQTDLAAIEARALQAEQDRDVMAQTGVAADLVLGTLRAELAAAEAMHLDTATSLEGERTALEAARAQLEALRVTLTVTQAEIATRVAERDTYETDAATAALAAAEAHRVAADATALLLKATADAEAARQLLEDESARVIEERAAKQELEARIETQRKAHSGWLQAQLPARWEQAKDQVSRVVRVETDRARRNQGSPAKIKAWAEVFYLQLEDRYVEALRTLVQEHLVFIGSTQDADAYTRALVAPSLLQAVQQIRTVADGDPEDFAVSLDRVLMKWEQDRPAALADRLFQEEMTYVRSL